MSIEPQQFFAFIDRALDGMLAIVEELGDDRVNSRPKLPAANPPYVIVHHTVQVMHWWLGMMGAGRFMERDRPSEFVASGTVAELRDQITTLRSQLPADLVAIHARSPMRYPERLPDDSPIRGWTQGEALIHAYEELAQHHGQLEITRDILFYADG